MIERTPLPEQVLNQLMEWIMDGHIHMGQKMTAEELAKQLGVSRMPVREALKDFERRGLVEATPYHGASLVVLTKKDVWQLYLMRSLLEPEACFYACKNATEEDRKRTTDIITNFEEEIDKGKLTAVDVYKLNRAFHLSIYSSCHLPQVMRSIEQIWDNLAFCKLIYGQKYVKNPQEMQMQKKDHRKYYELYMARKGKELKKLIHDNLVNLEAIMPDIVDEFEAKKN